MYEMNWIPVDVGLPERDEEVIVWRIAPYNGEEGWKEASYFGDGEFIDTECRTIGGVTHWSYVQGP
jgi:hypothetical protein